MELGTNAVAHPARIKETNTGIHVVAHAVAVCVSRAAAATNPERIELVAVAVAVAGGDV